MLFRLALKNITAKPGRAIATVFVVAIAVCLLFSMFSFEEAVYEYIFAVETADSGNGDLIIKTNSTSPRITDADGLVGLEGIEEVVPTLSVYALTGNEYVKLRGFNSGDLNKLGKVEIISGDASLIDENTDNVIISNKTAEALSLSVGSRIEIVSGNTRLNFYVAAIAENSGYFLDDNPYTLIGRTEGVSRLIFGEFAVYNEVFIKLADGADEQAVIDGIIQIPAYSQMTVEPCAVGSYIETQANSLSAPVVIAGLGVVLLAVAGVVLIALMSMKEKRAYIAKLTMAGATRKQILTIFVCESGILALLGAVVGAALASGVFMLILHATLSSTIMFSVSALKLCGAAMLGFAVAVLAALAPAMSAFRSVVRENEIISTRSNKIYAILASSFVFISAILFIVEQTVPSMKGTLSIVNVVLLLASLIMCVPFALRGVARLIGKVSLPEVKIATVKAARERRASRGMQTLTAGMTVVMLLFMAWSLTRSVFADYLYAFENMVLVTNVSSSVAEDDCDGIGRIEGVSSATAVVWRQCDLTVFDIDRRVYLLGATAVLDAIDFGYATSEADIRRGLDEGGIVLDAAYAELYGVKTGDKVRLVVDNIERELTVAGLTSHNLFSGNYAIVALDTLQSEFGVGADSVLVLTNGDPAPVAERIRASYAEKNYYAVEALTAFEWDVQSMYAIFDLVGTLAVVLLVLVYLVLIASSVISHSGATIENRTLLAAGMSKNSLLKAECLEYLLAAILSFVLSFAMSAAITASIIGALRLFGLVFDFMYNAGIVAAVGVGFALGYAVLPLLLRFKHGYNMMRK